MPDRYTPKRSQIEAMQLTKPGLLEPAKNWLGLDVITYTWYNGQFQFRDREGFYHKVGRNDWILKNHEGKILVLNDEAFKALFNVTPVGTALRAIYEEQ